VSTLWTSWSGRERCTPAVFAEPEAEAEIPTLVRAASDAGRTLRVAGSGHSFTPLVTTDGVLLTLRSLTGVLSCDAAAREATIRAGSTIASLGEPLRAHGLALANQGDVDVQALAGALATGTHGTGAELGSLSSQLAGVRLVSGEGEVVDVAGEADPELLAAARVSLGALGVVTAARLRLVPAYRLHERVWRVGIAACLDELRDRVRSHRHFEFFWYPHKDYAEMKALDPTEAPADPLEGRKGERIDWSDRVFPTVRDLRFNEMEYAVPAEAGPACFRAIRARMRERHPDVLWPVEYRTVARDDGWLSPFYGRDGVAISVHQDAALPCDAFFADLEPIFREHGGRPHWGKIHGLTARELAPLYPRWDDFLATRDRLDPRGVFLNDHLRRILGR